MSSQLPLLAQEVLHDSVVRAPETSHATAEASVTASLNRALSNRVLVYRQQHHQRTSGREPRVHAHKRRVAQYAGPTTLRGVQRVDQDQILMACGADNSFGHIEQHT